MKHMIKLPAVMFGLLLLFTGLNQKVMAQGEDVSLQSFYDELSPYGTWIQDPQYGYVWRPDVDQDEFRPYYSNGRWAMTEYGNTWVSDYDWGWAPFHYGRWVYNSYNEWIWLPDTVWGPAWVSWRSGGGYYGWAPLGPSINIGINIGRGGYRVPDMCWNFIPYSNIYVSNYPRYSWNRNRVYIQNTVIINNTYVRNNRTYYTGPRADEIRRYTNRDVTVYNINRSSRPGSPRFDNHTVNIYNPRPSRDNNPNPAPRNAVQGNINRGPVGRDQNSVASRNDRGGYQGDRNGTNNYPGRDNRNNAQGDRNNNNETRNGYPNRTSRDNGTNPQRDQNNRVGNPTASDRNVIGARPDGFDRRTEQNSGQPQRTDRGNQPAERNKEIAQQQQAQRQNMERSQQQQQAQQQQVQQQRVERSQPQQQPQQARTERVERSQPQSQQQQPQQRTERVERSQPQQQQPQQQQQRSSGGSESGGRPNGGGRPGRG